MKSRVLRGRAPSYPRETNERTLQAFALALSRDVESERAQLRADVFRRQVSAPAPVGADDEVVDVGEEPFHELAATFLGDVDELGPRELERPRWLPRERVAEEDAICPLGEPLPRQLDELRREVEPVRLEPVPRPPHDALQQVPVRAADVEEGPVAVDRLDDRPPRALPPRFVSAEAGLGARIV